MRCFKYFTWNTGTATTGNPLNEKAESEVDSDSDSSNSDTSNDTVSEQEALTIIDTEGEKFEVDLADV